jgi:hypothetical protein
MNARSETSITPAAVRSKADVTVVTADRSIPVKEAQLVHEDVAPDAASAALERPGERVVAPSRRGEGFATRGVRALVP